MKSLLSIFCVSLFCLTQVSCSLAHRAYEPSWNTDYKGVVNIISSNYNDSCVGTLIHSEWVLTSAVCAIRTFHQEMRILFGGTYYYFDNAAHIKNIYIHPGFISENRENDIALIELSKPANETMRIFKISRGSSSLVAKKAQVLRWTYFQTEWPSTVTPNAYDNNTETTETTPKSEAVLSRDARYVNYEQVVIIDNELCSKYAVYISENRLCTYNSIACEGDEGAPLVLQDELVGLISVSAVQAAICYSYNNCMFPVTTYTSVVPYRQWIREVTDSNLF